MTSQLSTESSQTLTNGSGSESNSGANTPKLLSGTARGRPTAPAGLPWDPDPTRPDPTRLTRPPRPRTWRQTSTKPAAGRWWGGVLSRLFGARQRDDLVDKQSHEARFEHLATRQGVGGLEASQW